TSFPEGILAAHQQLHALVPFSAQRRYFGISHPIENGKIVYKAAAEETSADEAKTLNLEAFTIRSGKYISLVIADYMTNPAHISEAFQQLLAHPGIDPNGYCLEWYLNEKDVRCMVGLKFD
ncbi:MAG TPA: transcriptional regulator, partial [Bacteroidia bacterium]|nr:transcriptional regulator [Bacteroidia bacterium]